MDNAFYEIVVDRHHSDCLGSVAANAKKNLWF